MQEEFYLNNLYPLQDKVFTIIDKLKTGFYLTGGTALSRFYLKHRYSDDLDFFVNNSRDYKAEVEKIYKALKNKFNAAKEKDLWVNPLDISSILDSFPIKLLTNINWINPIDLENLEKVLKKIRKDIVLGVNNSIKK